LKSSHFQIGIEFTSRHDPFGSGLDLDTCMKIPSEYDGTNPSVANSRQHRKFLPVLDLGGNHGKKHDESLAPTDYQNYPSQRSQNVGRAVLIARHPLPTRGVV
jgi:hypothetical protein